jgi:hypothetical protein
MRTIKKEVTLTIKVTEITFGEIPLGVEVHAEGKVHPDDKKELDELINKIGKLCTGQQQRNS